VAFPLFSETQAEIIPPELAKALPFSLQVKGAKQYEFASSGMDWKLSLSKDAIALVCSNYKRWEDFRTRFAQPFEAFCRIYAPAFFLRTGLRYINLIRRSVLGLQDVGWSELIQRYIAGEMTTDIAAHLEDTEHVLLVRLDTTSRVRIYHGIAKVKDPEEEGYLIDNDIFTEERLEAANAIRRLDSFNNTSGNLFRWCIAERLHGAMEPSPVESETTVG